jgi:hypothetical protein
MRVVVQLATAAKHSMEAEARRGWPLFNGRTDDIWECVAFTGVAFFAGSAVHELTKPSELRDLAVFISGVMFFVLASVTAYKLVLLFARKFLPSWSQARADSMTQGGSNSRRSRDAQLVNLPEQRPLLTQVTTDSDLRSSRSRAVPSNGGNSQAHGGKNTDGYNSKAVHGWPGAEFPSAGGKSAPATEDLHAYSASCVDSARRSGEWEALRGQEARADDKSWAATNSGRLIKTWTGSQVARRVCPFAYQRVNVCAGFARLVAFPLFVYV